MNIEEAKRKLHNMAYRDLQNKPYDLKLADVIQILNQIKLDQLKPEVPQFVADWYEEHKDNLEYNLYLYQMTIYDEKVEKDDFYYWIQKSNSPIRTLINMHQFGYTIEKEKLYTVDLPNGQPLVRGINTLYFSQNLAAENAQLTEAEIRKDFEWAWRFAEEVTE
ncbi:DUF1642 domain-containing protein [Streptococcus dysgalactiae]|uniref:DUF1642 domain-containing protein n=1 Tax=Streptococcus dysgalactiae TaxID=1334 RepID=UPI0010D2DCE8|nr:DUF1642 domain-containing protein [Streptococcus dysgalactiae]VTS49342.1 phage protein [Streptococcus dysgalactiae subsp. equisimilis]VTS49730.1 phage protein [Streptococcus dysgalactiae subsp. equisimilis]